MRKTHRLESIIWKTCESGGELDDPGEPGDKGEQKRYITSRALSSLPHERPPCNKSYMDAVI